MVYTHVLLYLHCSLISDSGRQRGRHSCSAAGKEQSLVVVQQMSCANRVESALLCSRLLLCMRILLFYKWYALKATHVPNSTGYFRCTKRTENKGCPGCGKIRKEEFEQFIFSAMQEKFKDFQILHGKEEKVNPKLTAYQVELAQVEAEIEKLLDTLTGANATLLAYANKKIEELDTRRQTISKAIAELSVETISPQQIKKLSYYLDNWDSIDFDDKRKAADGLISTIKATSDRVQIEWKI